MSDEAPKCPKCGHNEFDQGYLSSDGQIGYYSYNKKGFLAKMINCTAYPCMECGYVQLYVVPDELKKQLKKK